MTNDIFEPNLWNIKQIFENNMFKIPVYQRPYSWESSQVCILLDDLFNTYVQNKEEGYFIGSIYLHDTKKRLHGIVSKYDIIDGQQRLATITLLLLSIYSLLHEKGVDISNPTYIDVKRLLWKYINDYDRESRVIELDNIGQECFIDLFNRFYSNPHNIIEFIDNYKAKTEFDKKIIRNLKIVYSRIRDYFQNVEKEKLIDFTTFILGYVKVIAIIYTSNVNKAFVIFESINSKGKALSEIDKIKTYIFSKLEEKDYDFYLREWGELIIRTNDHLYDYLINYIKANIKFYRGDITVNNFKELCKEELLSYTKRDNLSEALAKFINELYLDVDIYNMLGDLEEAYTLITNNEFRFYFSLFHSLEYRHPKALFFRCLKEFKSNQIDKKDVIDIVRETTKFMLTFLSISNKSSKSVITMFATIMNDIYAQGKVNKDNIINIIANEIQKRITVESVKAELEKLDVFSGEKNKKLAAALLALYESTTEEGNNVNISYDMAYTLFNNYGKILNLDHLLVQTPKIEDNNFKYFCDENGHVKFKPGHDFDPVLEGIEYKDFIKKILNKIGNLRLWYSDKNSARSNELIHLKDYKNFNTYSQVCNRSKNLIKTILDKCIPFPLYNSDLAKTLNKQTKKWPRMDELIKAGIIKPGTKIYLRNAPTISEAILVDEAYVECKGEKMRITDWGKKFTGWSAIRIYEYVSIVGEKETLQQKRIKYMIEHEK